MLRETTKEAKLLDLWGELRSAAPLQQAALLAAYSTSQALETVLDWSIGAVEAALLRFHAVWFGDRLEASSRCDECGELSSLTLSCCELLNQPAAAPQSLIHGAAIISLQLPTLRHALDSARCGSPQAAEQYLQTVATNGASLTPEQAVEVSLKLGEMDPIGDTSIGLACASCGAESSRHFEALPFVLSALKRMVASLAGQVHDLAAAFGWTEDTILALPDWRRKMYLDRIDAGGLAWPAI